MKVLLAGGSGMIGRAVLAVLLERGHEVRLLVRETARKTGQTRVQIRERPQKRGFSESGTEFVPSAAPIADGEVGWNPARGELSPEAVAWADAVVSLNGASLTRLPWTKGYRNEILGSRVAATALIAKTIGAARGPEAWVSASAVGVYGSRPGETLTEDSPRGAGFLADVVATWEEAAAPAADAARVVLARTGVVLGPDGALAPLVRLARFGLGGRIGSGRQHWPWISLTDEARAIVHLLEASTLSGPVNLVAPTPATAADVTRAVARALNRPHVVSAPAWALRAALGDAARDLLLADQLVVPTRLAGDGFEFTHADLEEAVAAALRGGRSFGGSSPTEAKDARSANA